MGTTATPSGEIYLDHAATTPMRSEAIEAMLPWMTDNTGNPSGAHRAARAARRAVDDARDQLGSLMGADGADIVFTSGGTEADNLAIFGSVDDGRGAVCTTIEHPAVLACVESTGGTLVSVDRHGVVDLDELAATLEADPETAVVSVMLANNETGVVQPIDEVAGVVASVGSPAALHTDAVQGFGWLDPASYARADLVSISAHKFGGPQGVGCLLARRSVRARQIGGGQERELRSGTHNVAGIVAMAAAAQACADERASAVRRVADLRDRFLGRALALDDRVARTVAHELAARTLPGHAHLCVAGADSELLLLLLEREGVLAAAASSCASGAQQVSHVLRAMGVAESRAKGSLRFSLGWNTTSDDIDIAIDALGRVLERVGADVSS